MMPRLLTPGLLVILGLLLGLMAPVHAETYDPNGNLTSKATSQGTVTYTYDALDRLTNESGPGINHTYTYDPNGNRLSDGANTYTIAPNGNRIQTINRSKIFDSYCVQSLAKLGNP